MNNRHLPAGQAMQGAGGPGPEMGPGPAGSHRRRQYNPQHYVPQQQVAHSMYGGYNMGHPAYSMQHQQPYFQQPMSPYVQPGSMPVHNPYMPYQHQHYPTRSPPAHTMPPHYAPIVTSGMGQPPYGRHSPAMPSPYAPPPHHSTPIPSHTPTSTHSSQAVAPPPPPPAQSSTPPAPQPAKAPSPAPAPKPVESVPEPEPEPTPIPREPFRAPLPWFSHPDEPFPKRTKKKRKRVVPKDTAVELPAVAPQEVTEVATQDEDKTPEPVLDVPRSGTPSTPAEASTSPTSPEVVEPKPTQTLPAKAAEPKPPAPASRPAVPAVPVVPAVPKKDAKPATPATVEKSPEEAKVPASDESQATNEAAPAASEQAPQPKPAAASKPKTWSGLFANTTTRTSAPINGAADAGTTGTRSVATTDGSAVRDGNTGAGSFTKPGPTSLSDAVRSYKVGGSERLSFIEPRGLINTGNMCYMNSVLQVLIFCNPFYDFLDQVYKRAAHNFKSETPILDAMVLFMREFKVIASAPTVEQLRRRLKAEELEQFGEQFTPEFVYEAIRKLPRFASMRRGHQQDAEEFLGFLLESLHDECIQVMRSNTMVATSNSSTSASSPTSVHEATDANGWLEVGPRQRAAVTRSSGTPHISSPVTKIFGGQLRSELRVPGLKDSVTLEPYQPLQLDIGSPNVRNIVDALKGLTNPETLHGDFNPPRGKDVKATKQVFIESLPPVLILHLKRFQFDAEGNGTIKIWKKVGYPLELEIPKEVFSRQKRNSILAENSGLPKYKLSAVVYHHGKNASGGHYTIDARRQDGREWIRMDDTVIRRIGSEDVAEGGAEEDAKSRAPESRKDGIVGGSNNPFAGINEDEAGDEDGWKQVTAQTGKKWSSVVNGGSPSTTAAPKGKQVKDSIKDNKVAYLLFYQRM